MNYDKSLRYTTTLLVSGDSLFLGEELYLFPLFQSLEDNPEFEYLRNILYEYMLGRQPMILVKVGSMLIVSRLGG
jgi:hypothetical protein